MNRPSRGFKTGITLVACAGLASPAVAQISELGQDSTGASRSVFGGRQAYLGLVVFSSAATIQIDGLDQLDVAIKPSLMRRNAIDRRIPRNLGRAEVAAGASVGLFLVGEIFDSEKTSRVGVRTIETLLVNSVLTSSLKIMFGRARPDTGYEEDSFAPFSFNAANWSFPSGHTSTAFAWATALSNELRHDAPYVPYIVYPLAVWVATSRMLDGRHWLTDTVAGAAVGIFSAHLVDRLHSDRAPGFDRGPQFQLLIAGGPSPMLGASLTF